MEWSIYNYLYYSKTARKHLLYNSLSNALIELSKAGYEAIQKIMKNPELMNEYSEFAFLREQRFIVDSNDNEINKIVLTTLRQRFSSNLMSLTIAPTLSCNFACPYCYEGKKSKKRMTKSVQNSLIDFIKQKEEIKHLSVIWYGGEPTMSINTMRYLTNEFVKLVDTYNAYMVSNGFLLDKAIPFIKELKISGIQITLDGTQKTHDSTRCLFDGSGTFNKIMDNIHLLLSQEIRPQITIRMNISKDNAQEYVALSNNLYKQFGNQVNLYPAFVHDYTGCGLDNCIDDSLGKATFIKKLYIKHGLYTGLIYPTRSGKGCMRQTMNAFVVGPSGELYKCWHHIGQNGKIVGSIMEPATFTNYGNLADMMISKDVIFDKKCRECVLFPSCYGGCADLKCNNAECCIPAKKLLEDYLDIHYLYKTKQQSYVKD